MQTLKKISLLGCLLVTALAGCAKSVFSPVGTWKVSKASLANIPKGPASIHMEKLMEGMGIVFRDDYTYTLNMGFQIEGTWIAANTEGLITLKTTKLMGQDLSKMPNGGIEKSFSCQVDSVTNLLTIKDFNAPAHAPAKLIFEKQ